MAISFVAGLLSDGCTEVLFATGFRAGDVGTCLAALGVLICVGLLTRIDYSKSLVILAAVAVALLNWLAVRKRADSVAS